jgi:hypothetical protein
MSTVQEKIDGLIALMQKGVNEGERTQARKAVIRLCEKHGLNIDDILLKKKEADTFLIPVKNREEGEIFAQAAFRYANPEWVGFYKLKRCTIAIVCVPMKYLELMAAWSVLKISYREEKKIFMHAFCKSNCLLSIRTKDDPDPSPEEMERANRAALMSLSIKTAVIHRQLPASMPV